MQKLAQNIIASCVAALLLAAVPASANTIHRYYDEDGVLHITTDSGASSTISGGSIYELFDLKRTPTNERIIRIASFHAQRVGLDRRLVLAVIQTESSFRPRVVSHAGAQGLMQLIPATAARFDVTDPFDIEQNIRGGVDYLAWLIDRFDGDVKLALAGYNAGEGAVDRFGGIPPYRETQRYVRKVRDNFVKLAKAGMSGRIQSVDSLKDGNRLVITNVR